MNNSNIWEAFDSAKDECYMAMVGLSESMDAWTTAFELFRSGVVRINLENSYEHKMTITDLEEETDWAYDFSGWLEDYTDELDMREKYQDLSEVVDFLLKNFDWSEDDDLGVKQMQIQCLWETGYAQEAYALSKKWLSSEKTNPSAKSTYIQACLHANKAGEARKLIEKEKLFKRECDDTSYPIFHAASEFYKSQNDFKRAEKLETAMEIYDEKMEEELLESCYEDDDEDDFF